MRGANCIHMDDCRLYLLWKRTWNFYKNYVSRRQSSRDSAMNIKWFSTKKQQLIAMFSIWIWHNCMFSSFYDKIQYAMHDQLRDNLQFSTKNANRSRKWFWEMFRDRITMRRRRNERKLRKRNTVNSVWFTSNENLCPTSPIQSTVSEKHNIRHEAIPLKLIQTNIEKWTDCCCGEECMCI